MLKTILQATLFTSFFSLITGIVFPMTITFIGQSFFPYQSSGSLIKQVKQAAKNSGQTDAVIIGSELLSQSFKKREYFHSRPSAAGEGYAGESSSGTNLGPTSKKLFLGQLDDPTSREQDESFSGVKQLADLYRQENNLDANFAVPIDAVTRSSSGLDPDISIINAKLQAPRIAKARNISVALVNDTINRNTSPRQFYFLGEPRVNVLMSNLALDKL
jgi:K+-transporting ATPase ATPase C chain